MEEKTKENAIILGHLKLIREVIKLEVRMKVIKRVLTGTSFVATLCLDETQARHFDVAEGRKPDVPTLMDPEVMKEMINLVAHFRKLDSWELAALVADEVRVVLEEIDHG